MKRKHLLIALITLAAAATWFFTSAKYPVEKNVHVLCNYMAYACGDCYPQYKVKLVMPESLGKKLTKNEIDVEFQSQQQERKFEKERQSCAICYDYDFSGNLYYSNRKRCYVLNVKRYKLTESFKNCCGH